MTAFDATRARFLAGVLAPVRPTRVVDIGANPINDNPYAGLLACGLCEVWGFEPQPQAFRSLVAGAGPNEHYLPHAVGAGGPAELRICRKSGFSSLLEPDRATFRALGLYGFGARVMARETVETMRLDDMTDLPEFDLLKIDVQGGEAAVFEGGRARLAGTLAVITEVAAVPLYTGQPLLDDQMRVLRMLGFDLHRFLFFKQMKRRTQATVRLPDRHYRSQLIDGDAVFVRCLLALERHDDEALKHLAILADAVFGSADLAVVALAELARRGAAPADLPDAYVDLLPYATPLNPAPPEGVSA